MKRFFRRLLLIAIARGLVFFFSVLTARIERGRNPVTAHDPWPVSAEAQALHDRLIIGDWHAGSRRWPRNLNRRGTQGQVDIPRLNEGNGALQVFTTVTKSPAGQNYESSSASARGQLAPLLFAQRRPLKTWFNLTERARYQARRQQEYADDAPDQLRLITTRAELKQLLADRAAGARMVGGMMGAEGGQALSGDIDDLQRFCDAGFRTPGSGPLNPALLV
jgi:membrane dipeptidase